MPAALCLAALLAGCSSGGAADGPAADSPGPAAAGASWAWAGCDAYTARLDAPSAAFPADAPGEPVAGTVPGQVEAAAFGMVCLAEESANRSAELWVGFPMQGRDELVLLEAFTGNATRADMLAAAGAPVRHSGMALFYSSRMGVFYQEGPGTEDREHALSVSGVQQQGAPEPYSATFVWGEGNATAAWSLAGAAGWWQGPAHYGTTAFVHPDHWQGTGERHGGTGALLVFAP